MRPLSTIDKVMERVEALLALPEAEYDRAVWPLYEPVAYTLEAGGKRLRPRLCLAAAAACGANPQVAVNQAAALEMFHNFTLIHDDVMDRSDTRRGRPTVFARNGAVQAILSGDTLLTLATERVAVCPDTKLRRVLERFNTMALRVYEGQQMDMAFETQAPGCVPLGLYLKMISLKTSALLECACRIGAYMAGASEADQEALGRYAYWLGQAFQLRDDWLDTFGTVEALGKPIGGDIRNRKHTALFIKAYDRDTVAMNRAYAAEDPVAAVTEMYSSLGLDSEVNVMIADCNTHAFQALESAQIEPEYKKWFSDLITHLTTRLK